jgi:hypothetical protein
VTVNIDAALTDAAMIATSARTGTAANLARLECTEENIDIYTYVSAVDATFIATRDATHTASGAVHSATFAYINDAAVAAVAAVVADAASAAVSATDHLVKGVASAIGVDIDFFIYLSRLGTGKQRERDH